MKTAGVLRYAAFADTPDGGNPAGVMLDASGLSDAAMLAIAAEVGYSESAFLIPLPADDGRAHHRVRFFSRVAEVPFCGHATIASAVALAERHGPGDLVFHIDAGPVPVRTAVDDDGFVVATLTSVAPSVEGVAPDELARALGALCWNADELDPMLPPRIAYAGARHLVLAAASRERLARLDYDFEALKAFMLDHDLTTVHLVWRADGGTYHARDPFPVGGVVEDPATGAAAAAFGAYLRALGHVTPPATIQILQGDDMGRPSRLTVDVHADRSEISVTGRAVAIDRG